MNLRLKPILLALVLLSSTTFALAQLKGIDPNVLGKATAGDAQSQLKMGEIYAHGKGVAKDMAQAAGWYLKAADQGLAQAQYKLAVLFHSGEGVEQNYAQAALWYRRAAEQGIADAQIGRASCRERVSSPV